MAILWYFWRLVPWSDFPSVHWWPNNSGSLKETYRHYHLLTCRAGENFDGDFRSSELVKYKLIEETVECVPPPLALG